MALLDRIFKKDIEPQESLIQDLQAIAENRKNISLAIEYTISLQNDEYERIVIVINSDSQVVMAYNLHDHLDMEFRLLWGADSGYSVFIQDATKIAKGIDTNRHHIFTNHFSHNQEFVDYLDVIYQDYVYQKIFDVNHYYENNQIVERTIEEIRKADINKLTFFNKAIHEVSEDLNSLQNRIDDSIKKIGVEKEDLYSLKLIEANNLKYTNDIEKLLIAASDSDGETTLQDIRDRSNGFLWVDILEKIANFNERGWVKLADNAGNTLHSFSSNPLNIRRRYDIKEKIDYQKHSILADEGSEIDGKGAEDMPGDHLPTYVDTESTDNDKEAVNNLDESERSEDSDSWDKSVQEEQEIDFFDDKDESQEDSEGEESVFVDPIGFAESDAAKESPQNFVAAVSKLATDEMESEFAENTDTEDLGEEETTDEEDSQDENTTELIQKDVNVEDNSHTDVEFFNESEEEMDDEIIFDSDDYVDESNHATVSETEEFRPSYNDDLRLPDLNVVSETNSVTPEDIFSSLGINTNDFSTVFENLIKDRRNADEKLMEIPHEIENLQDELEFLHLKLNEEETVIEQLTYELEDVKKEREEIINKFEKVSSELDEKSAYSIKSKHRIKQIAVALERIDIEQTYYSNVKETSEKLLEKVKKTDPATVASFTEVLDRIQNSESNGIIEESITDKEQIEVLEDEGGGVIPATKSDDLKFREDFVEETQ